MHDAYQERETVFAAALADRADWERATRHQRHLAVAADAELRRRHPGQPWAPLRSAEPELVPVAQPGDPARFPEQDREQEAREISEMVARHREFADKRSRPIGSDDYLLRKRPFELSPRKGPRVPAVYVVKLARFAHLALLRMFALGRLLVGRWFCLFRLTGLPEILLR